MASKPKFSEAIRRLLTSTTFPIVGTFQAAGAISREEFAYFGGAGEQSWLAADKHDKPAIHELVENVPSSVKIEQAWIGEGSLTLPVCRGKEISRMFWPLL
jgi:hypothetical protein